MTTYRKLLTDHFDSMKSHPLFVAMSTTVEASPWHREANVLVHTEMVVNEYLKLTDAVRQTPDDWTIEDYLGGLCCVWHDTGKPAARTPKNSPERGDYFAYHGHELLSARLFENYAVMNSLLHLNDLFIVEWMIHHHMPWSITDQHKLASLKATPIYFGDNGMYEAYTRALLADQFGRIADDQEGKNASASAWVEKLNNTTDTVTPTLYKGSITMTDRPVMFVPIGPSGAGKSTLYKNYVQSIDGKKFESYSLDALRHRYYDATDYAKAYQKSVEDSSFESRAKQEFMKLVKAGGNIYIDNTNLSAKRRAFYISEAKRRNYVIVAFHLTSSLDTLKARQRTRGDKNVPDGAVYQQYMALTVPSIGEFDSINVV